VASPQWARSGVTKPPEPAWLFTTAKIFKAHTAIAIQLAGTRDCLAGLHG
jgi:hypothetical protein